MKIIKRFVWLRSVAAVTIVSVLLLGCASDGSMNRTQKGAAIGGASGAAVGGLIGSKKGKTGKGAVIGGVAGAVLGGFVGQYMDKQAKELEQVAETERVDDGIIVTMKDKILFDFNSADLTASSRTSLQKMAAVFKNYEKTSLTVTGHPDNVGRADWDSRRNNLRCCAAKVVPRVARDRPRGLSAAA